MKKNPKRGTCLLRCSPAIVARRAAAWLGAIALLASALALPGTILAGEEVTVDGVIHVKNGSKPSHGKETLKLEELWRHGGEEDETFFGVVTQAMTDEKGNVYVLDNQLNEVQVYSPAGEYIVEALNERKHVVTANKALLAKQGAELVELASKNGVDLCFEASVAGGIPIIRALREGLAANNEDRRRFQ